MTIYDVLIADHREAVTLLKKAEKAEGKEQQQLLVTVIDALSAHADAEGEILYDNIADASDDLHDLIMEAHEEHLSAAHLMKELLDPTVTAERRTAKTTVLREQVEHTTKSGRPHVDRSVLTATDVIVVADAQAVAAPRGFANIATAASLKACRSSGLRRVTRLPSMTTCSSTTLAPAFFKSP